MWHGSELGGSEGRRVEKGGLRRWPERIESQRPATLGGVVSDRG